MSNFETLEQVSQGLQGSAVNFYVASTADSLATILAAGYLDDQAHRIKPNDVLFINYADTSTQPVHGLTGNGFAASYGEFSVALQSSHLNLIGKLQSYAAGITAHAGASPTGATLLTAKINSVDTVASAGDSLILPIGVPGMQLLVANNTATNSMNIYPATGGQINGAGANTAFACAARKSVLLSCAAANLWVGNLSF